MNLNSDFVTTNACVGRLNMPRLQLLWCDLVCYFTGHLLWRTGSVRRDVGSLPIHSSYCRRCYVGGYVQGDYA